jgi:hypothetical protein
MLVSMPARVTTALRLLRTAGRTAADLLLLALLPRQLARDVCCISMVAGLVGTCGQEGGPECGEIAAGEILVLM